MTAGLKRMQRARRRPHLVADLLIQPDQGPVWGNFIHTPRPPPSAAERRKRSSARPRSTRWFDLGGRSAIWSLSDGNREAFRGASQGTEAIGADGERQFEPLRREVDKGAQLPRRQPPAGIGETNGQRRPTMAAPNARNEARRDWAQPLHCSWVLRFHALL